MAEAGPLEKLGYLFYIMDPRRSSFESAEEVPDYTLQVFPSFMVLIIVEYCICMVQGKPPFRVNDAVSSISQGILHELVRIFLRGVHVSGYCYVHRHWRVASLPWDSAWTWLLCLLGADFAFYWFHRAAHEINIFWASHQVHHNSEDFYLPTALRQSVVQGHIAWVFYLPLATVFPPSAVLVHTQINLLCQFWIHNEIVVSSLGPLGYVLNTASHHRVHHGRNRYCIDKNFGGMLIIWDRIFGTFQPESEPVAFGITRPLDTFDPIYSQGFYYWQLSKRVWRTRGFGNKLSALFKGPGWRPGTPWHGNLEDIPDVSAPVEKYDPKLPRWCEWYVLIHFCLTALLTVDVAERKDALLRDHPLALVIGIGFIVLSCSSFGVICDKRSYAPSVELFRCYLFSVVYRCFLPVSSLTPLPRALLALAFALSALLWMWQGAATHRLSEGYPHRLAQKSAVMEIDPGKTMPTNP